MSKGWHIKTGREDGMKWWHDFTFYFGEKPGARFIGFHFPLHTGWQSHPKFWWNKSGWEYYEPAILIGHVYSPYQHSHWYMLGRWLFPANVVHLWRMRHKDYRDTMKFPGVEVDEALLSEDGSKLAANTDAKDNNSNESIDA